VNVLGFHILRNAIEVHRHLCVVLQEYAVELYLSVVDNLDTYARFHSFPRPEVSARIERVTDQFSLTEYCSQKVIDPSGGLKRRVQAAKVFMVDQPLVFLDEATTGMDPINKRATLDAIHQQARAGRTVFLTAHILAEAEELSGSNAGTHCFFLTGLVSYCHFSPESHDQHARIPRPRRAGSEPRNIEKEQNGD
jgi:ABC-2 type transport system ATP-binding protein